jgi:uncharacterized protein (DUF433 family)
MAPQGSINWRQFIVSTPEVLHGKPRIDGTRIPVALVLGYLASGADLDEIRAEFPDLKPEHVSACLDYARESAEFEIAATRRISRSLRAQSGKNDARSGRASSDSAPGPSAN